MAVCKRTLSTHALALVTQLLCDAQAPGASSPVPVNDSNPSIKELICQRSRAGRPHAPLAVPAA